MKFYFSFISLFMLQFLTIYSSPENELPVSYNGRFRPLEALDIKEKDIWQLHLNEYSEKNEMAFHDSFLKLQNKKIPIKQIQQTLENNFPFIERLQTSGTLLKMLPGRYQPGEWFSLHALKLKIYASHSQTLERVTNFTIYSNETFEKIQGSYLEWEKEAIEGNNSQLINQLHQKLVSNLHDAYKEIASTPYLIANEKILLYPSLNQLKWESYYYHYPLLETILILYASATLLLFTGLFKQNKWKNAGLIILALAFILHTVLLIMRCYILSRPPVSNMFETIIYVPWIAVVAGFILHFILKSPLILFASSLTSLILMIILKLTGIDSGLENVQAVLDSQFWLIVHVLMVVGSFGVYILCGVLGHIYLSLFVLKNQRQLSETSSTMKFLAKLILQTMYLGTALLIPGTILGGIWAAQSWGRFWDWDPKESWAFISSCIYLIWIHSYRFGKIGDFGLAFGSVTGLLAISFTWYGVNYILGTGLHSYGFGSGGEFYYYGFLLVELIFLTYCFYLKKIRSMLKYY